MEIYLTGDWQNSDLSKLFESNLTYYCHFASFCFIIYGKKKYFLLRVAHIMIAFTSKW